MRLTLRTLLAYLDDILEPAQAKEIGAKIAESEVASALADRIRDVMRRRRLTAPDVNGPGARLDPNTVAEYLDNTLPAQHVADLEKVCLDSDVHLAEIAACHQILTLVLGEPVDISPQTRERMYALAPAAVPPQGLADNLDAAGRSDGRESPHETAAVASQVTVPANNLSDVIPDYLKPRPLWRRTLPWVIVAGLLAAFVGLIATDPSFQGLRGLFGAKAADDEPGDEGGPNAGRQVADAGRHDALANSGEPGGIPPGAATPAGSAQPETDAAGSGQKVTSVAPDKVPDPGGNVPPQIEGLNPPPPPDAPEDNGSDKHPVFPDKPPVPGKQPPDLPGVEPPKVAKVSPAAPVPPEGAAEDLRPAVEKAPPIQYISGEGVLVHWDGKEKDWLLVPHRAMLFAGERVAAPAPFDSELDVGQGRCRVTLLGGTSVTLLPPSEAGAFGFDVQRGRIVIAQAKADKPPADRGDAESVVLSVRVRDETWKVELMTPETVCGIEIVPAEPEAFEQPPRPDPYTGGLYVRSGSVRLFDGKGDVRVIAADAVGEPWTSLTPSDRKPVEERPASASRPEALPDWLDLESDRMPMIMRRYARFYENELELMQPLSLNVPPIVKDRRPKVSEMAVLTLAVTESYPHLVEALNAEHEEARRAAIVGLRQWLPMRRENGKLLQEELARVFTQDDAERMYRLLWGYSKQDAADRFASRQLVEWLAANHVAVRELAFYHVQRLTGRTYDYRPNLTEMQRKLAVNRWQTHMEREGALLK